MPPYKKFKGDKELPVDTETSTPAASANGVTQPPSNTQVAPTRQRVRGKRGILQDMPNLPLDVLGEIFGCMHPKDLLNLARTNKIFRSFLMSRSAASFWKAARANVPDLPDCPPYLSEPAYANLVFFYYCHNCLKAVNKERRLSALMRLCAQCEISMFVCAEVDSEVKKFLLMIQKTTGTTVAPFGHFYRRNVAVAFYRPDVEKFRLAWNALGEDVEAKKLLAAEKQATVQLVSDFETELQDWMYRQRVKRAKQLRAIRSDRAYAIIARLREEGWGEELDHRPPLTWHCMVSEQSFARLGVPLTNQGWRNIREDAIAWIESEKEERLLVAWRRHLYPRFNAIASFVHKWAARDWPEHKDPLPGKALRVVDYLMIPDVREVMESADFADPTIQVMQGNIRAKIQPLLKGYIIQWLQERKQELIAEAKKAASVPGSDDDDLLHLAIHLFDCALCPQRFMTYPSVLAHRCVHVAPDANRVVNTPPGMRGYELIARDFAFNPPSDETKSEAVRWDVDNVRIVSGLLLHKIRVLLRACGMDPEVATHADMQKCRKRLTCADCTGKGLTEKGGYQVFDWERALYHLVGEEHGDSPKPCRWVVLPEEIAARVRRFEQETSRLVVCVRFVKVYECKVFKCGDCNFNWAAMLAHLEQRHGIKAENVKEKNYKSDMKDLPTPSPQDVHIYHTKLGDVRVAIETK